MPGQGPLTNQVLGGTYLLGEVLGQGGFGVVYKAQHQRLNRAQAVKVLSEQHFNNQQFRARFIREAQTLAALDHPNILHVDELGEEGNLIYLVMPFIPRGTFQGLLKQRGPLPVDEAGRYLEQICGGLRYAHKRGVVHLDLKPLNLLVHDDGRLLLSDFGLAHLIKEGAVQGGASLTFGTPFYMAPEHLRGQPDWRSDLYSMGVILFQMLAGRLPLEGPTPEAIIAKLLTEPAPPLRQFRPDLPPSLEWMVAKALAKRPEDRYQKASEFFYYFRDALAPKPAGYARPSTPLTQVPLPPTVPVKRVSVPVAPGPTQAPSGFIGNYAPLGVPYPASPVIRKPYAQKMGTGGKLAAVGGLVALLAFLLPWLTYSVNGFSQSVPGTQIVSGGRVNWFILEPLCAGFLLLLGLLAGRARGFSAKVSLPIALIGMGTVISFMLYIPSVFRGSGISYSLGFGIWLALVGFGLGLAGAIRGLREKQFRQFRK
ncbi:MAG TPA: protein kinase [Ktedonobacterales bacterium]